MTVETKRRAGERFWVLGGRWVEEARHLPRPRVFGPYRDYLAALDSAEGLNALGGPNERYLVVADVPASEEVGVLSGARQPGGRWLSFPKDRAEGTGELALHEEEGPCENN